jgi:2-octaprenyl-6-methoxyphenol hydroxylase
MAAEVERRDVVIGGGGFAGLALAIALRQALGEPFTVTVADPALRHDRSRDPRATAIAAAARRLFEAIGVWTAVENQAQPILDMVVTDSKLEDAVRPTFLTFGGEVEEGEPFAHMVENRYLVDALVDKARAVGVDLRATAITAFEHARNAIDVALADGSPISARLLVGADGARSTIRERADIASHGWNYGQSAIVTTVAHERDHEGCAEEHFLPAGPFAILPLTGRRSSIVWTEHTREADRIIALPDEEFRDELERRFGLPLGEIEVIGPRHAFPLGLFTARSLAPLRHHDHGRRHRRAEPPVFQPLRRAAADARRRPWSGRTHAGTEEHFHPRSRGRHGRGAKADAGRGVVNPFPFQGRDRSLTTAECCRRDP